MDYVAELTAGHKTPVELFSSDGPFLIGLVQAGKYKRAIFFHAGGELEQPDPWLVAVRPVAPTQACRAYPIPILAKEKVL